MSDQSMENIVGFQPITSPVNMACRNGQLYTIKSGDTMFFIAKRYNISLQDLINANPQIVDPNTIFPGQVICIPVSMPKITCPNGQIYHVVRGDTMFEIARRFGISLDALIAANPQVKDPNLIFPGQEICIPISPGPGPVPCSNGTLYTVKSGDTLFDIARANNISLAALIMANPQIPNPNLIFPGQIICIPRPTMEIPLVPMPMPIPTPVMPIEQPMPMPTPVMPIEQPMPMPMPVMPIEQPMPIPAMPCPSRQEMMCPMPVCIVIPWDECPHRPKKKKHDRCKRRCH